MAMRKDEAETLVDEFVSRYKGLRQLTFVFPRNQEDLYGPNATADKVGLIKGSYHPSLGLGGVVATPLAGVRDVGDLGRTLRHEALGHFGINTFAESDKRDLLDAIAASRSSPSMAAGWAAVDRSYASASESIKAEELFCRAAETSLAHDPQQFVRSWAEAVETRARPLEAADLDTIAAMVAEGLERDARPQRVFPANDQSQFSIHPLNQERPMATEQSVGAVGVDDKQDEQLTKRDVVAGAAHTAQLADIGGPMAHTVVQAVGVVDAARVASDIARGKEVRAIDAASAAASVAMTTGVGGAAVQVGARVVAGVSAIDAGQRAINTLQGKAEQPSSIDSSDRLEIEKRNEALQVIPVGGLDSKAAFEAAKKDVEALNGIDDQREQEIAAAAMGATAAKHDAYKVALGAQGAFYAEMATMHHRIAQERGTEKTDRKELEAQSMSQDRVDAVGRWTKEEASSKARSDAARYSAALDAGDLSEVHYQASDMQVNARESAAYKAALEEAAPSVATAVAEHDQAGPTVTVSHGTAGASAEGEPMQRAEAANDAVRGESMKIDAETTKRLRETRARDSQAAAAGLQLNGSQAATPQGGSHSASHPRGSQGSMPAVMPAGQGAAEAAAQAAARTAAEGAAVELHKQRERALAVASQNTVDVVKKGGELEREEFVIPRRILTDYTEQEGKFFAKDSNRLMFHDQGEKLATSTTDKKAIADMVSYAKAKQWDSLKLTGSQEFRREAWLQAESQGIKTQGFTPREADLAALKALTQERSTNSIVPMQESKRSQGPVSVREAVAATAAVRETASAPAPALQAVAAAGMSASSSTVKIGAGVAPRHDLNKDQAGTAAAVAQNRTTQIAELQAKPSYERYSADELSKIAFYRALLMEREKGAPENVREAAMASFDNKMRDPLNVKALPEPEIQVAERNTPKERTQERDTVEHSL